MAANTNYQDLNALLQTLSAYSGTAGTAVQQGQQQPQQQPEGQHYDQQAPQAAPPTVNGAYPYDFATSYDTAQAQWSYAYPQSQQPNLDYYRGEPASHPQTYSQQGHGVSQPPSQPPPSSSSQHERTQPELQPYDPTAPLASAATPSTTPPLPPPPQSQPASKLQPHPPAPITTWPPALRHVTSLAAHNAAFGPAIRAMITNQRTNELAWSSSRRAILAKQAARVIGKRELDDVLRSVGALQAVSVEGEGEKPEMGMTDEQELKVFDRKVHKAAVQMERAMVGELGTLGVPFFGGEEGKEGQKGGIGKDELRKLQLKMIQHLEDLYKD